MASLRICAMQCACFCTAPQSLVFKRCPVMRRRAVTHKGSLVKHCATKNCLPSLVSYRPLAYAARLPGRVVADGTRRCYCYRCRGRHRDAADRLRETLGYSGSRDAAVRPGIRGRRVPRACGLRGACVRGDAEAGLSGGLGRRVARCCRDSARETAAADTSPSPRASPGARNTVGRTRTPSRMRA